MGHQGHAHMLPEWDVDRQMQYEGCQQGLGLYIDQIEYSEDGKHYSGFRHAEVDI
jgi:hypothetical protein